MKDLQTSATKSVKLKNATRTFEFFPKRIDFMQDAQGVLPAIQDFIYLPHCIATSSTISISLHFSRLLSTLLLAVEMLVDEASIAGKHIFSRSRPNKKLNRHGSDQIQRHSCPSIQHCACLPDSFSTRARIFFIFILRNVERFSVIWVCVNIGRSHF